MRNAAIGQTPLNWLCGEFCLSENGDRGRGDRRTSYLMPPVPRGLRISDLFALRLPSCPRTAENHRSRLSRPFDQAADDSGDEFKRILESDRCRLFDEAAAPGDLQERDAFLGRTTRDREEGAPIGLCEAAIPLGPIVTLEGAARFDRSMTEPQPRAKPSVSSATSSRKSTAI
jgi:hypothetical protein